MFPSTYNSWPQDAAMSTDDFYPHMISTAYQDNDRTSTLLQSAESRVEASDFALAEEYFTPLTAFSEASEPFNLSRRTSVISDGSPLHPFSVAYPIPSTIPEKGIPIPQDLASGFVASELASIFPDVTESALLLSTSLPEDTTWTQFKNQQAYPVRATSLSHDTQPPGLNRSAPTKSNQHRRTSSANDFPYTAHKSESLSRYDTFDTRKANLTSSQPSLFTFSARADPGENVTIHGRVRIDRLPYKRMHKSQDLDLPSDAHDMTVAQLKQELKRLGLHAHGKKNELICRMRSAKTGQ